MLHLPVHSLLMYYLQNISANCQQDKKPFYDLHEGRHDYKHGVMQYIFILSKVLLQEKCQWLYQNVTYYLVHVHSTIVMSCNT